MITTTKAQTEHIAQLTNHVLQYFYGMYDAPIILLLLTITIQNAFMKTYTAFTNKKLLQNKCLQFLVYVI